MHTASQSMVQLNDLYQITEIGARELSTPVYPINIATGSHRGAEVVELSQEPDSIPSH